MNKERQIKNVATLCFAALAVFCLFCTCAPTTEGTAGDAAVTITIGGGSRGVLSWDSSIDIEELIHTITFTGGPGADVIRNGVKAGQTASFTVEPGHWDIAVKAYLGELLVAEGLASVDLKPGRNGPVQITMGRPGGAFSITMLNDGNGTATATPNPAAVGVTVEVHAAPNNGFMFKEWQVISGDVTLSSATATPASFTMPSGSVTIKALFEEVPPDTPYLYLSDVTLSDVTYGYTQPSAQTVTIHNTGNTTANVSGITLGGADAASFELGGNLTPTVAAGESATFTVRPKTGLDVGTYAASVTATYSGGVVDGDTAETDVSFTVNAAVISSVNISIDAPVKGGAPNTEAAGSGNFTVGAVSWSQGGSPLTGGIFLGGTAYTATVTLTADDGHIFTESITAVINGDQPAEVTNNTGSAVTLSCVFAATEARTATKIEIKSQPSKTAYTHGDPLDLSGLVVTLISDDDTTEDVPAARFRVRGITTNPQTGENLIHLAHNGMPITITYGDLPPVGTGFLTVNPKVITFNVDTIPAQTYTGGFITPAVTVKDDSTALSHNTDYTVAYANNTNAGTATVTVTGEGNYAGSTGSGTFTINPKTIAGAQINVTPPVKNATPSKTATGGDANGEGDFEIGSVSWSQAGSPFTGEAFLGGVVYTASVTLTAKTNYTFTGFNQASATITGQPATVSVSGNGSTVTLSRTFPVTDTRDAKSISVISQPDRLSYTHGDTLDLTGLKVKIVFDDETFEDFTAAEFSAKNIGAIPAHGNTLICAENGGKPVTINYGDLTCTTDNLTVAKAAGAWVGVPAIEGKPTINSITINAVATPSNKQSVQYGYSLSPNSEPSSWQYGLTFSGLNNGTTYYIFARAEENPNYKAGTPSVSPPVTTLQPVSPDKIVYYWIDKNDVLVTTSGNSLTIAAGVVLIITAQGDGYTVKQWRLDGVDTGQSEAAYNFKQLEVGSHNVGLFVEKNGRLYNTNITVTVY